MKQLRLFSAVLAAVKAHFDNNTAFSARDITEFIEDKIDVGDWEVMNFDFNRPKVLKHESVQVYITELFRHGLFYGDVIRTYETNNDGDTYKLYTPVSGASAPVPASSTPAGQTDGFQKSVADFVGDVKRGGDNSDDDSDPFDDLIDSIDEDEDSFSVTQTTKVTVDGVEVVIDKNSVTVYSKDGESRRIDLV